MARRPAGFFAFGGAPREASMGGMPLRPHVGGATAGPYGSGYWLAASEGGVVASASATFFDSMGKAALHQPIIGIAAGPTGAATGWWPPTAECSPSGAPPTKHRPVTSIPTAPGAPVTGSSPDGGVFALGWNVPRLAPRPWGAVSAVLVSRL